MNRAKEHQVDLIEALKDTQEAATAYHEAGHGVIAYRLGFYVDTLTIVPDSIRATVGHSLSEAEWCDGSMDREAIIVLYAGYSAEKAYYPDADTRASASDHEKAHQLLRLQPEGSQQQLRAESDRLVKQNWKHIEAVATVLLENKTLPGDDWSIIIDSLDEGSDWRRDFLQMRLARERHETGKV
jgi:ATP-dependent Zn protease